MSRMAKKNSIPACYIMFYVLYSLLHISITNQIESTCYVLAGFK